MATVAWNLKILLFPNLKERPKEARFRALEKLLFK
jgi:hypothetical protein